MLWNVAFIYNAFIRTTDHCKVQTAFVSLFYIFINMKPWNALNSSVVVVGLLLIMLNGTLNANLLIVPRPLGHLTNFCSNFYDFFVISENSLKLANFFAKVTNSRFMKIFRLKFSNCSTHTVFICNTPMYLTSCDSSSELNMMFIQGAK